MAASIQSISMKWKEIKDSNGLCPKPRHGHRCVAYGKFLIIFGGGNEGIVKEINVYNTVNGKWFAPATSGGAPPGCAAFGLACYDCNLIIFGGIEEKGTYSNDMYKVCITNWNWSKLKCILDDGIDLPCPRLGHSFASSSDGSIYMFGGVTNDSSAAFKPIPRYLDDLYKLTFDENGDPHWSIPKTTGEVPPPRESHSCAFYKNGDKELMIIYGGMCGKRLGDIYFLDLATLEWTQPITFGLQPPPRSLHVAGVCDNRMVVFGGWAPIKSFINRDVEKSLFSENEWICTNDVASFNIDTLTWENVTVNESEDLIPRPRAGHCGAILNKRLYIWSGRDGFKKNWNDQVCWKDLWYLETAKADPPKKIYMDGTDTYMVNVRWDSISNADFYIIQVMKVGQNTFCNSQDIQSIIQRNLSSKPTPTNSHLPQLTNMPALKLVNPIQSKHIHQELPDNKYIDFERTLANPLKNNETHEDEKMVTSANITKAIQAGQLNFKTTWLQLSSGEKVPAVTLVSPNDRKETSYTLSENQIGSVLHPSSIRLDIIDEKSIVPDVNKYIVNSKNTANENCSTAEYFTSTSPKIQSILPPLTISNTNNSSQLLTPKIRNYNAAMQPLNISPKKIYAYFNDIPNSRWFESCIVSDAKATISQFCVDIGYDKPTSNRSNGNRKNIPLEPNFTYRLRVASVNSCGIGAFSQPLAFSTCAPGLPGSPNKIHVIKGQDIVLSWEPVSTSEKIDYSVYIAKPITKDNCLPIKTGNLSYIYDQIYNGPECKCSLTPHIIDAYISDINCKNVILLRIVAKNCKGYGPVTQIKWCKDEIFDPKSRRYASEKIDVPLKRLKNHY